MRPNQIRAWRHSLGLTQAEAARRLLTIKRTYERWEAGTSRPPEHLDLACAAVAKGLPPWTKRRAAMSYRFANAQFNTFDEALKCAWYELLNLGALDNEQLRGLTARELYDSFVKDVGVAEITDSSGDTCEIDEEDHVDAIQEVLDEEWESRVYYRAEMFVAGDNDSTIVDEDRDWEEIIDTARRVARNSLDPDYGEPVWCGADAWHPASDGAKPLGGYEAGEDQGGGGTAVVIYEVRP